MYARREGGDDELKNLLPAPHRKSAAPEILPLCTDHQEPQASSREENGIPPSTTTAFLCLKIKVGLVVFKLLVRLIAHPSAPNSDHQTANSSQLPQPTRPKPHKAIRHTL
ncbi:hypothetical protein R1flu_019940 [Riccia fluitans]|uniref:Uncharacterized protein n=1 Tax=Riccia fluitans TaxID=41844 RepID=A0ABD1ZK23_9MARC